MIEKALPLSPAEARLRARAAYTDPRYSERDCDHCQRLYRGPAVYCSLDCALADAANPFGVGFNSAAARLLAVDICNEPCQCPPGQCAHFVEPPGACINRLTGEVRRGQAGLAPLTGCAG